MRAAVTAGVLLLLAVSCQAASTVTLSSIKPNKLSVNLTYMVEGQQMTPNSVCQQQAPGSECLPKPHAARDSVMIKYSVLPQYSVNSSDTVLLKACYSTFSRVNRPWRALNDIIADNMRLAPPGNQEVKKDILKSKACPFVIKQGLNPGSGNATWKIPNTVPTATYFVRALVYAKNASDAANPNAVAIGDSLGYFQVIPINSREKGLKAAAGICICVGPILFTTLMLWEFKFKKA